MLAAARHANHAKASSDLRKWSRQQVIGHHSEYKPIPPLSRENGSSSGIYDVDVDDAVRIWSESKLQ